MSREELIRSFFKHVVSQDEGMLRGYFLPAAYIRWNNTNEQFSVEEYIIANCEYPGNWGGEIERIVQAGDIAVSAARVWTADKSASFHVTSFFEFSGEKIAVLNEYWGDDGDAPQWRLDKHIGRSIHP